MHRKFSFKVADDIFKTNLFQAVAEDNLCFSLDGV